MLAGQFSQTRRLLAGGIFGHVGAPRFLEERFLPQWLPVLLGLGLGMASALLIAQGQAYLAVPLALAIPVAVLFLRYPFASVILWLLISPFLRTEGSTVTVLAYWVIHRTMIPAALVIVVLADWLGQRKRQPVRFGVPELLMAFYLLYGLLNMFVLNDILPRTPVLFYDRMVVPLCMYWLIRLLSPGERDLKRLTYVACGLITSQVAIGFVSWFAPGALPPLWRMIGGHSVGTFGSPHPFTAALTFSALLILQYAAWARRRTVRVALVLIALVGFVGVFFSFERSSWLAGVLVLAGLLLLYPRITLRIGVVVLSLSLLLGITVFAREVEWAQARLNDQRTAGSRLVIWTAGLKMIGEKPLFGWGYGNYDLFDEQFKTRVLGVPVAYGDNISSHNAFITIGAETGLVGLVLYLAPLLWWLGLSLLALPRLRERRFGGRSWLVMLWLVLLQQSTVGIFSDIFRSQSFITVLWWMSLALIAGLVSPGIVRAEREPLARTALP